MTERYSLHFLFTPVLFLLTVSLLGCSGSSEPSVNLDARVSANDTEPSQDTAMPGDVRGEGDSILDSSPVGPEWNTLGQGPGTTGFWMEMVSLEGDTLHISVRAKGLGDVVGYAFRVLYQPEQLEFLEGEVDPYLQDEIGVVKTVLTRLEPGVLTVAAARFLENVSPWGDDPLGRVVEESFQVADLAFKVKTGQEILIWFDPDRSRARRSDRTLIPGTWSGVRVVPGGAK